jgi:hypothetical protein
LSVGPLGYYELLLLEFSSSGSEEFGNPEQGKCPRRTESSLFRGRFETVADHNGSTHQEKSSYCIRALQGRATEVLDRNPKGTVCEETLQTRGISSEKNILPSHIAVNGRSGDPCKVLTLPLKSSPPHLYHPGRGQHEEGSGKDFRRRGSRHRHKDSFAAWRRENRN